MHKLLIVEDDVQVRVLMMRWLMSAGHSVVAAGTAAEALKELTHQPVALVLSDIGLPGRNGLWLAGEIRRRWPETVLIMATGSTDFHNAINSLRHGAIDYLRKPIARIELLDAVQRGVAHYDAAASQRDRLAALEVEMHAKRTAIIESTTDARVGAGTAIDAMLGMLDAHVPGSRPHSERVARLTADTALLMGIGDPLLSQVENAALLHDIGRIALPIAGVDSPEAVDHAHVLPELGAALIGKVSFLERSAEIVRGVGERYDGTGHPSGLHGRQIPLGARIVALANCYDELTECVAAGRATAMPSAEALVALEQHVGTQFDPEVFSAFQIAATLNFATTAP